ncbi:DUF6223 family protein [Rhodococcus sp. (in: high G+C Gram-positive bacteria)]|uniref:DUF6223 family protein n=1 Tax=Rhodococcus sp. TaxID=1831 RepID=UPI003EFE2C1D
MSVFEVSVAPLPDPASIVAAGYELGVGRAVPTTAAVLALIGVVAGAVALRRSRRSGTHLALPWIVVALATGAIGVIVGGMHGANAAGGPNTGNGVVGALFAVVLGVIAVVLGGLSLARYRRTERAAPVLSGS